MHSLAVFTDLASLGAAGIMGAMWLWERRASRAREEQLTDAHERIRRDEQRLEQLTRVVEQNTAAFERFAESQRHVIGTLRELTKEMSHARST